MSDDDFMMEDTGDDDYDFEYEDDGDEDAAMEEEGGEGDVENQYYVAKNMKEDDLEGAIKAFRAIIDGEEEKGEWGFKSLKQTTKILYLELHRPEEALERYRELLGYTKSSVTKNVAEKAINNILDYVGGEGKHANKAPNVGIQTLEAFYNATMAALEEAKNDRLTVKCNLKLAKLWLERKEYGRLRTILRVLHQMCAPSKDSSGTSSEDQTKATQMLEIYSIEIQMYSDLKETKKLRAVYEATLKVRSAIAHPRILGLIRECGGKMWMAEKSWNAASTDFFESFKQYDEAGSPRRIQVLKYLVLTYMLMGSQINPFESQETKPYRDNPQVVPMTNLVAAYQSRDVHEAERIIRTNKANITDDPFIKAYIDEVLRSLRTQYLIDLIKPYTRMELSFLARQLNIETAEVEDILIGLILDGKVKGTVDQVNGRVELERLPDPSIGRYKALDQWSHTLSQIQSSIVNKTAPRNQNPDDAVGMGMNLGMSSSGFVPFV